MAVLTLSSQRFLAREFISFSVMKDLSQYIRLSVSISNELHVCGKLNTQA